MALRTVDYTVISTSKDWKKFLSDELKFSPDVAEGYADEFASQNITGSNIVIGLSEPGFLSQFNMSIGHQLELKAKFQQNNACSSTHTQVRPNNKVPTPTIRMDITQIEFDQFRFEWERYKEHYNIKQNAATSLFFCCAEDVRQQLRIAQTSENLQWSEETMMEAIRQTVLSKISPIVHRKQFSDLKQESNENVQKFLQKLQAKASCCNFSCRACNSSNVEERVKEKFILGLKDTAIQRSVLKTESISPNTPLAKLLTEAITLEQSIRDQESIKLGNRMTEDSGEVCELETTDDSINAVRMRKNVQKTKCSHCGLADHSSYERREKCPAWGKKCHNCGILHHFKSTCLKPKRNRGLAGSKSIESAEILFIGEVSSIQLPVEMKREGSTNSVSVDAFPDTGANICLMGPSQLNLLKLKPMHLNPCNHHIQVAGGSTIVSTGWTRVKITLEKRSTNAVVYFSKRAKRFFLSRQCCRDLNIISQSFPHPPPDKSEDTDPATVATIQSKHATNQSKRVIPKRPSKIPFQPVEENIPALKKCLLISFATSAFSREKPFPALTGPPAEIHLKPNYVAPKPAYHPSIVAEHWSNEVKDGIDEDVEAKIMRWVPFNEPTKWCARMVVVKKKDGRPRRTVDYQELNKQCLREPNHGTSPFHTARCIPENTWKSVLDAVDGYHSVKIDEESSKLTTFISPWGRLRYLRFPQGHCSAGDAFNGRVQAILAHVPRLVRIVDDMCIYDETIEQAFWHAWDLLTTCAQNGIVINESKFQFCSLIIDFAGLTVTVDGVKPSSKILQAIKNFPPPTDIGKARAFFGLLNQVQWAYANSTKMAPFRDLVKPNSLFQWTPQLKQLFEEAKDKILQQVEVGVRQYNINRPTCLQTDFCKDGLGYLLLQKFCNCSLDKAPLCCTDGWRLVFAGSRFTKGAEARYAPTEGEALAVAWALNHAHIFTKGCPNLIISTDHKPLIGILNDKPLEKIKNPRILRLKEQMLQFEFSLKYNPGKWHRAADALSRNPSLSFIETLEVFSISCEEDDEDNEETSTPKVAMSMISPSESLTVKKVQEDTASDHELIALKSAILNGFPQTQHATDPLIRGYFNGREHLSIDDGIIIFKKRIVIPKSLRYHVLQSLHSAHQGTQGMRARAAESVYWPGINASIDQIRKNCKFCDSIAPSQPRQPLKPLPPSTYPFQYICADAFTMNNHQYLAIVDKFSGWLILYHFPSSVLSKHIVTSLRSIFHTYGTPLRLYTDGGLPFASYETREFLQKWGVKHIISSAHYPQSNGRAELGVKTAKRILHENVSPTGSLNTDAVSKALLQYRNTPIHGLGLSPAQILFHRSLRDAVPTRPSLLKPHRQWISAAKNRERAFERRNLNTSVRYNMFTKGLPVLAVGNNVMIQDFTNKRRWNKTGRIVERDGRKYTIRVHGSGRIISRNRRFLKVCTSQPTEEEVNWDDPTPVVTHTDPECEPDNSEPASENSQQTDSNDIGSSNTQSAGRSNSTSASSVPLMLRRLFPHNNPGCEE